MPDVEIVDRHGHRRRARPGEVLADGERFALPMQFMDMDHAAYGFRSHFSDGSTDFTSSHRPGYRFADMATPRSRSPMQSTKKCARAWTPAAGTAKSRSRRAHAFARCVGAGRAGRVSSSQRKNARCVAAAIIGNVAMGQMYDVFEFDDRRLNRFNEEARRFRDQGGTHDIDATAAPVGVNTRRHRRHRCPRGSKDCERRDGANGCRACRPSPRQGCLARAPHRRARGARYRQFGGEF